MNPKNGSLSVFFGVIVAGLIGLIVTQWITGYDSSNPFAWWFGGAIGAVLGGFAGWVAFNLKGAWVGAVRAWEQTVNYSPNPERWKTSLAAGIAGTSCLLSFVIFVLLGGERGDVSALTTHLLSDKPRWWALVIFWAVVITVVILLVNVANGSSKDLRASRKITWKISLVFSPIALPFVLGYVVIILVAALMLLLPPIITGVFRGVLRFLQLFFAYAHCTGRTVTAVYAFLAVIAGHFFGGGPLAVVACAMIAVLNYELITNGVLQRVPIFAKA